MTIRMKPLASVILASAVIAFASVWCVALAQSKAAANTEPSKEWPTYGHDAGGMRFSPLTQITPANVGDLKVAWVYHMRPAPTPEPAGPAGAAGAPAPAAGRGRGRGGSGLSGSETTPIVANGMMYLATPYGRVVALDPTNGKEEWGFQLPSGQPSMRGVEYWPGDAQTPAQIVFGSSNGKLYSLDAKTGKSNDAFGDHGVVELNTPEILQGLPGNDALSSPPIMYQGLIITGGRTQENPPKGPAGDVRAWDVHNGKLVWTFHSIPQGSEKYNDTWAADSWKNRSGVNVWGFITVDTQRGIVYMPFGAPSVDQYGGDRAGDNLFGSSVVAADAKTGKYLWHFQVVHHDVWDGDLTGALALIDVKQGGRTIPAVAAINKLGMLFLLDRVTGKPIYGVEERPVPQSEVPLERTAKTQPFPLKPAPLSRMTMTAADIATVTPELEAACKKLIEGVQLGGPYLPPAYKRLRVQFPGNHGGVNWGGTSFNPQLGYLFVNTNELGQLSGITDRDPNATGPAQAAGVGNRVDPNGPYQGVPGGGRFSIRDSGSSQQLPCQQPPWGQLTAVNVNTGEFAWRVPLGVTDTLPTDKQHTGRPGNGGTIATAGGLVFVGATDDSRFRAFDAKTGKELWTVKLGGAAEATPSTYLGRDGKQYVMITSTGGGFFDSPVTDDSIMAFALPSGSPPPNYPTPVQGEFTLTNFHFRSGETMDVRMHYRTIGAPQRNPQGVTTNAVLAMHGTGGSSTSLIVASFAGELMRPGGLLDGTKYFIVFPDDIGHGQSSKPRDGLHAKFPHYGYLDMVEAEYRLLTDGLGVNHARLIMGTSMGAMHTWLWGEEHPDFMDALMPLASLPTQISGRNRAWRRVVIDAITHDPGWMSGEYTTQPESLRTGAEMLYLVSDNTVRRQASAPTLARADQSLDQYVANYLRTNDANDLLYALRASEDYDPGPKLEQIKAPLYAVNSYDDLVNPGELGVLEREITRVPKGKAVVIPLSSKTAGHGTHTLAAVWKRYLDELLKRSAK